jgi:hypothetical protein
VQALAEKVKRFPFIVINVTGFLTEFLTDAQNAKFLESSWLLSSKEAEVIQALRSGKPKRVVVEFQTKEERRPNEFFITYTRKGEINKDDYEKITSALFTNDHVSVKISKVKDDTLHYETTFNKKIRV